MNLDKDGNPIEEVKEGEDNGNELTPEQQKVADTMVAEAEEKGEEVSDDEIAEAIAAMRGESKTAKGKKDDPKGKEADPKAGNMVPQARFDEATGALKDEIAELKRMMQESARPAAATPAAPRENPLVTLKTNIEAARDKYDDAVLDGDKEATKAIRAELSSLEDEYQTMLLNSATVEARTQSSEDIKYNTLLEQLESDHPVINPDHKDFDKPTMQRMARISNALINDGTAPTNALKEAAALVLPKPDAKVDENLRTRNDDAKKNTAAALANQPPDLKEVGSPRGSVEPILRPSKLTDKQLESLPDDVASQLRGDTLSPDQMEK